MDEHKKRSERNLEQWEENYTLHLPDPNDALEHDLYPHTQTTFFVHGYEFIIALDGQLEYVRH